ncbi:hypothetical protein ACFYZB_39570 [Streptomyces sp. NPDC001852]|uniref:hypothetical protein n=1 Tax=Streptomyces sp. NPDC001852 TaxID=3364619 RepID=UPI0036CE256B
MPPPLGKPPAATGGSPSAGTRGSTWGGPAAPRPAPPPPPGPAPGPTADHGPDHGAPHRPAHRDGPAAAFPHRTRRWTALVAFGVVAALAAALLTRHDSTTPHADPRAPFATALVDLALQPGVRYRSTTGGSGWTASRVTATGEALGEAPYAGTRVTTLTVGGTTYVRMPDPLPPGPGGADDRKDLAGRWVTGVLHTGAESDAVPRAGMSPATLANLLLQALDSGRTTLPDRDAAPVRVGGVPALRARTPQGDLYVSTARPYRVLEFVPSAPPGSARQRTGADASAPAAFTVSALSRAGSAALLGEIRDDTAQLSGAVDTRITARVEGEPRTNCSAAGCDVSTRITGLVADDEAARRIRGGRVTAEFTATVTIGGRPAGTCTATEELPLDGSGEFMCSDADAGPVFAEQEAESASWAQDGTPVSHDVRSAVSVRVLAQADVAALRQAQQQEEQLTREAPVPADVLARAAPARDGEGAWDCTGSRPEHAVGSGAGWILNTLGANGRSETGQACLKNPPDDSGTQARTDPYGYAEARAEVRGLGRDPGDALTRCHIVAARFGGSSTLAANLSPCGRLTTDNGTFGMAAFEDAAARERARQPSGTIHYLVEPFFASARSSVPRGFVMIAIGCTPAGLPDAVVPRSVPNVVERADGGLVNLGN